MVWNLSVLIGKHKVSHGAHPSLLPSHHLLSFFPSLRLLETWYIPLQTLTSFIPFFTCWTFPFPLQPSVSYSRSNFRLPVSSEGSQGTRGPKSNPPAEEAKQSECFIPLEGLWGHPEAAWDLPQHLDQNVAHSPLRLHTTQEKILKVSSTSIGGKL